MKKIMISFTMVLAVVLVLVSCGEKAPTPEEISETEIQNEALEYCNENYAILMEKIENVFDGSGITFSEINDGIIEYNENYALLTEENKTATEDIDNLNAAFEEYKAHFPEYERGAAVYIKAFLEINEGKNYEITDIGCVVRNMDGRDGAFYGLKYKDEQGNENSIYSETKFPKGVAVETAVKYQENCFVKEPVADNYNALENRNVILDLNTVMEQVNNL